MKILILGHKGMLGNCVHRYLSQYYTTVVTDFKFPNDDFKEFVKNHNGIIVNCIGAIPQKTNEFSVNVDLPIFLSTVNSKIIHPGTDCEGDGTPYGTSKKQAADYLLSIPDSNTKILKSSIIGKELSTANGLLEWFLNSDDTVNGYTNARWNGITTLEWAKYCRDLISNWDSYKYNTILCSGCISKYELLLLAKKVFNKKIRITPVDKGENKCLGGIYTKQIYQQLKELKKFYE